MFSQKRQQAGVENNIVLMKQLQEMISPLAHKTIQISLDTRLK